MLAEFDAELHKDTNKGAWTCVTWAESVGFFGTGGLVKVKGTIDGERFESAFMADGKGGHRLPVKADVRKKIGKEAGDRVSVRIDQRIS